MHISDTFTEGDKIMPARGFRDPESDNSPPFNCECDHTSTGPDAVCSICGGSVPDAECPACVGREAADCDDGESAFSKAFDRIAVWILISIGILALLAIAGAAICAQGAEPDKLLTKYGVPDGTCVVRGRYGIGYDGRSRCPRWVLERLDGRQLATKVDRDTESFHPDQGVPKEFRATVEDYRGSGFDIGHMAPANTHRTNQEDLDSTFLFSNATPQLPEFNRGLWRTLEAEVRTRGETASVWVVTCPLWIPSKGKLEVRTIGPHAVWIPSHCGKAVLVEGPKGVSVESWILPNVELKGRETKEFRVSVDEFEAAAGLDLWSELPDELEIRLEGAK